MSSILEEYSLSLEVEVELGFVEIIDGLKERMRKVGSWLKLSRTFVEMLVGLFPIQEPIEMFQFPPIHNVICTKK